MAKYLTEQDLLKILKKACYQAGSQRAWADAHGLSPSFVSDVLQGKRDVTAKIARALGYVKFTGFCEQQPKGRENT